MKLDQRACICGAQIVWGTTAKAGDKGGRRVPLETALVWIEPKKGGKVRGLDGNGRAVVGDLVEDEEVQRIGAEGFVRVRESHFARCPKADEVRAAMQAKLQAKPQTSGTDPQAPKKQGHFQPDEHPNAPNNPLGLHKKRISLCECGEPVSWVQLGHARRACEVDELEVIDAPKGSIRGERGAMLAAVLVSYTDKEGNTKTRYEARLVVQVSVLVVKTIEYAVQPPANMMRGRPLHTCAGG